MGREAGFLGDETVRLKAVLGNLQEIYCKYYITVLFELAEPWDGAKISACLV